MDTGTRLGRGMVVAGRFSREEDTMYPYGISVGGIVLLIVLIMLLTGRI
jgi:hypothetical protein